MRLLVLAFIAVAFYCSEPKADDMKCFNSAAYSSDLEFELDLCVQQIGYDGNTELEAPKGMNKLRVDLDFDAGEESVFSIRNCDQRTVEGLLRCDVKCDTSTHRSRSVYVQLHFQFDSSELVFSDARSNISRDRDQLYFDVVDCRVVDKRNAVLVKPVVLIRYLERKLVDRNDLRLQAEMNAMF